MATPLALIPLAMLQFAATGGAGAAPEARACPGPRVNELVRQLDVAADRFDFEARMLPAFLHLWAVANRPALPLSPDRATVLAAPGKPLVILYGRDGCAIGALSTTRPELWRTLRATIGPAV